MTTWTLDPSISLRILVWSAGFVALTLVAVVALTFFFQVRADRRNRQRIAAFQTWEEALPGYLFTEADIPEPFLHVGPRRAQFFRDFLNRCLPSIGGSEAERLRQLYHTAGLESDIAQRLRDASDRSRASAAMEVNAYGLSAHLPDLVPMLADPVPFVALAAARTLGQSGDLTYAGPVLEWVVTQDQYQHERLIALLEGFGPDFLEWLEALLRDRPALATEWRLFALLVASHRHHESLPVLLELLDSEDPEVRGAAIRGLQVLGDPVAHPAVARFISDPNPWLRMQATQALGALGGPAAIPDLQRLLADPSFDVRRHASLSLAGLGVRGTAALQAVVDDPAADAFARDMALERLEWVEHRGRL